MKLISTIIILLCFAFNAFGQKEGVTTLKECIEIALANNPILKQQELKTKRDNISYNQAWQNQLPQLDANLSHGYNQGRTIDPTTNQYVEQNISSGNQSLNASLMLFDGLRILSDVRMKANARTAGKLEYEGQINALKLDVIEAYINVLTAQDMLDLAKKQWELTKQQYRRSTLLHQEGAIPPSDYYDIKGQYSLELNNLRIVQQTLYASRLKLSGLLNCPEEDIRELEKPKANPMKVSGFIDGKSLYNQARLTLPEFKAFDYRIKEAEQNIKVAKSAYFPKLSLGAGMYSNYSSYVNGSYFSQMQDNLGKSLSFNLSIPIFSGFTIRNQVNLAKINLQELELGQAQQLNNLRNNTSKAIFDLMNTKEQVENLQEQEQSYAELHRISQVQFEEGVINSVDYLAAKNKWDTSKSKLIVKQYELIFQKYLNDYYAGNLIYD